MKHLKFPNLCIYCFPGPICLCCLPSWAQETHLFVLSDSTKVLTSLFQYLSDILALYSVSYNTTLAFPIPYVYLSVPCTALTCDLTWRKELYLFNNSFKNPCSPGHSRQLTNVWIRNKPSKYLPHEILFNVL